MITQEEQDNWYSANAKAYNNDYTKWFSRTYSRLYRQVRDPKELARRMARILDPPV